MSFIHTFDQQLYWTGCLYSEWALFTRAAHSFPIPSRDVTLVFQILKITGRQRLRRHWLRFRFLLVQDPAMLRQCDSLELLMLVWLFLGSGRVHWLGQDIADAAGAVVQRVFVHLVECFMTLKTIHSCWHAKQHRPARKCHLLVRCKYIYKYTKCTSMWVRLLADLVYGFPSHPEEWFSVIHLQTGSPPLPLAPWF